MKVNFLESHCIILTRELDYLPDNSDRISIYDSGRKNLYVVVDRVFKFNKTAEEVDIYLERIS